MTAPEFVVVHKRLGTFIGHTSSPDLVAYPCRDPNWAIRHPSWDAAEATRKSLDEFRDAYEVREIGP